jgi:hypothetical protein
MTTAFITDFHNRKRQVRHYLAIVMGAERIAGLGTASRTRERRLLTLRAGTFLILYNLIEATTREAVDAIHDRITTEKVPFGDLTQELRAEVVRRFKRDANPATDHTMVDLPCEFVAVALDQGVRLSGNVDARYIRSLGECYGFSCDTTRRSWGGADLLTIKSKRNDLAHGLQTFEDVGRDYPSRELAGLTRRSLIYMGEIINNIATYLDTQSYRHRPPT